MNSFLDSKSDKDHLTNETRDVMDANKGVWYNSNPQRLADKHVKSLVEQLKMNPDFSILSLQNNNLTAITASRLSELLKVNTKIKWFHLSYNEISDAGAQAICSAMKSDNKTLTLLDLAKNRITDRSTDSIVEMIVNNRTLTALILKDNELSRESQQRIIDVAQPRKPRLRVYL